MTELPLAWGLALAGALLAIGMIGVLVRRNVIFILISVEIMLNAAGLGAVVAGAHWGAAEGQVLFIFILTLAAAEVCVGLGLILLLHRRFATLDADAISTMRD